MQAECNPELLEFPAVEGRRVVPAFDGDLGRRRAVSRRDGPGDPSDWPVCCVLQRHSRAWAGPALGLRPVTTYLTARPALATQRILTVQL
jgi:hypothetical protein